MEIQRRMSEMEEPKEIINKFVNENCDSITIGTPGKMGEIKCYGNFNDVEAFKKKIANAEEVRKFAAANIFVNV